jgi:hypothetical protein
MHPYAFETFDYSGSAAGNLSGHQHRREARVGTLDEGRQCCQSLADEELGDDTDIGSSGLPQGPFRGAL